MICELWSEIVTMRDISCIRFGVLVDRERILQMTKCNWVLLVIWMDIWPFISLLLLQMSNPGSLGKWWLNWFVFVCGKQTYLMLLSLLYVICFICFFVFAWRALKTRTNTPKYGLIFHSTYIGRAGTKNKGRISRYLANKCSIASRIDCFAGMNLKFVIRC